MTFMIGLGGFRVAQVKPNTEHNPAVFGRNLGGCRSNNKNTLRHGNFKEFLKASIVTGFRDETHSLTQVAFWQVGQVLCMHIFCSYRFDLMD